MSETAKRLQDDGGSQERHAERRGVVAKLWARDQGNAEPANSQSEGQSATSTGAAPQMGPLEAKLDRLKPARLRRAEEQTRQARAHRAKVAEAHAAAVAAYERDERKPEELRQEIGRTAQELVAAGELVQVARAALTAEREQFEALFAQEVRKMVPGFVETLRSFAQARASIGEVERFASRNGLGLFCPVSNAASKLLSHTRLSGIADQLERETNA